MIELGTRRELFIDDHLVDSLDGASRRLHKPQPQDVVMVHDQPWEGSACGYHTILRDGDLYRMYYKAWHIPPVGRQDLPVVIAYAESNDGLAWRKPALGLIEHDGSKQNNIVFAGKGGRAHDFSVFIDPAARSVDDRYKAVGLGKEPKGLYAFKSADGLRWSLLHDEPIITGPPFDTQNIVFFDSTIGRYRAFVRDFREIERNGETWRCRDVMTAVSDDMIHWSPLEWLRYPGAPDEELYTNQIQPYYRAPHILLGMPARYVDRGWKHSTDQLPELDLRRQRAQHSLRYGAAVTDSLLMASRDGRTFQRWPEAFLRPGLRTRHNWSYGDNYIGWGIVETASTRDDSPNEISLYATESYFTGHTSRLRRHTLRIDGFVSIHAPIHGGAMRTPIMTFSGQELSLNVSTSASGSVRVEIQRPDGTAVPGFAMDECDEIFGDALDQRVSWSGRSRLDPIRDQPIRLNIALCDADLYSLKFV